MRKRKRQTTHTQEQGHTFVKRWIPVEIPKPWHPKKGDELIGEYGGAFHRSGSDGSQYACHIIHTRTKTFYVSGRIADALFISASLQNGTLIKLVSLGLKDTMDGLRQYKDYELYIGAM